jgi:hypothetical protein
MHPVLNAPRDRLDRLDRQIAFLACLPHVVYELLAVKFLASSVSLHYLET